MALGQVGGYTERVRPTGQIVKAVSALAVVLSGRYLLTKLLGPAPWAGLLTYMALAFVATFGLPVAITLSTQIATPEKRHSSPMAK